MWWLYKLESQLQKLVVLSSTEVEYIVACDAAKEGIWLRALKNEIGFANNSVSINIDNQSAIHLSKNHVYHDRTKFRASNKSSVDKIELIFLFSFSGTSSKWTQVDIDSRSISKGQESVQQSGDC